MSQQQLQPINHHQQPVSISPDYAFTSPPQTKCVYHPQFITHFCKKTSCLLPLCQMCLQTHPTQHAKSIETIQSTLTQVYRGYAKRANEIAIHQRQDILQLRQDLHSFIDSIFQDLLKKADQNYQQDLIVEWRNLISKLEKLKDSQTCMKEAILYFVEPDQGYHEPLLTYQNNPIKIDQFQLQQAKFHLNRLFTINFNNAEPNNYTENEWQENAIRRVSSIVDESEVYQIYNYTDNGNNVDNNNKHDQSPIRLVTPIDQQYSIQSPIGQQYIQPVVRTPYTVPSIYTVSTVRPFKQVMRVPLSNRVENLPKLFHMYNEDDEFLINKRQINFNKLLRIADFLLIYFDTVLRDSQFLQFLLYFQWLPYLYVQQNQD